MLQKQPPETAPSQSNTQGVDKNVYLVPKFRRGGNWVCKPVISTRGRLRQEHHTFEASLRYTVSPYLKSGMESSFVCFLGHLKTTKSALGKCLQRSRTGGGSYVVWWKKQPGGVHALRGHRRVEAGDGGRSMEKGHSIGSVA